MSAIAVVGTEYVPGPWVCFGGERMWLLADMDLTDPAVGVCWDLIGRRAGLEQVLGALTGAREGSGHNFAVAQLRDTGAEVMVRGTGWAQISAVGNGDADSGHQVMVRAVQGDNAVRTIDGFDTLRLGVAGAETSGGVLLPLGTAVVAAAVVMVYADDRRPSTAQPAEPVSDSALEQSRFAHMLHTSRPDVQVRQLSPEPTSWTGGPDSAPRLVPEAVAPGYPEPVSPTPSAAAGSRFAPSSGVASQTPAPPRGSSLSADGVIRAVPWAAIDANAVDEPYPVQVWSHAAPGSIYAQPDPLPHRPPAVGYQAPTPAPPPAFPVPPAGPSASPGADELMNTIRRTSGAAVARGPMVEAVKCGLGHLNPPRAFSCRICREPVPPQEPAPAPRPPLGKLRLSIGDVIVLDRGVIFGRAPGAPENKGRDEPHRYKLPSPDASISRQHCQVVLDEWSVNVVDLNSTNGTALTRPDGTATWLEPDTPHRIEDGWTVSLDPTTWFRYEVTE